MLSLYCDHCRALVSPEPSPLTELANRFQAMAAGPLGILGADLFGAGVAADEALQGRACPACRRPLGLVPTRLFEQQQRIREALAHLS